MFTLDLSLFFLYPFFDRSTRDSLTMVPARPLSESTMEKMDTTTIRRSTRWTQMAPTRATGRPIKFEHSWPWSDCGNVPAARKSNQSHQNWTYHRQSDCSTTRNINTKSIMTAIMKTIVGCIGKMTEKASKWMVTSWASSVWIGMFKRIEVWYI